MFAWLQSLLSLFRSNRCGSGAQRSRDWAKVRAEHLKANPACCITGDTNDVEVHHLLPYHLYPEYELSRSNLRTVRRDLHFLIAHSGDWSAFNPNFEEDAALMRKRRKERRYGR